MYFWWTLSNKGARLLQWVLIFSHFLSPHRRWTVQIQFQFFPSFSTTKGYGNSLHFLSPKKMKLRSKFLFVWWTFSLYLKFFECTYTNKFELVAFSGNIYCTVESLCEFFGTGRPTKNANIKICVRWDTISREQVPTYILSITGAAGLSCLRLVPIFDYFRCKARFFLIRKFGLSDVAASNPRIHYIFSMLANPCEIDRSDSPSVKDIINICLRFFRLWSHYYLIEWR